MNEPREGSNELSRKLVQLRPLISTQKIMSSTHDFPMSLTQFSFSSAFALGFLGLAFHRTHLLSALLCLEGIMLSLYIAFSLWALELGSMNFSTAPLLLLAFSACEASAGLALLVATSRTHGTDHLHSLNLLGC